MPRRAASVSRGSLCGRLLDRGWREAPSLGLLPLRWGSSSPGRDPALGHHGPPSSGRLTTAAVSELAVLSNLQFGGIGGGDAVTGLHAVPLFQLCQGAHEAGVGGIQGGDALLLWANRASAGVVEWPPGPKGVCAGKGSPWSCVHLQEALGGGRQGAWRIPRVKDGKGTEAAVVLLGRRRSCHHGPTPPCARLPHVSTSSPASHPKGAAPAVSGTSLFTCACTGVYSTEATATSQPVQFPD